MRPPRIVLLAAFLLAGTDLLPAAEPTVRAVNPRGVQVGATTAVVLDGDDLGKSPALLLPFPAKVALRPGNTDKQATFDVTVDDATPGYHHLRVVTDGGVSLPAVVAIDRLPQKPFGPAIDALPVALHGTASGSVPVETKFAGRKGMTVRVEVEAQRLGSKLRPVVHLVGPSKREVSWAWPNPALGGDARLEATLAEDGDHTVSLHDVEYAGANPGFFRLRVGDWSGVEQVFPPVIGKEPRPVELLTSLGVEKLTATPTPGANVVALPWPAGTAWSGPRPFVRVSPIAELLEAASAAKGQELPEGPVAVSGKLLTPLEEDRYVVPVKSGQKVKLEVQAERLGAPLDVALVVRNPAGGEVARAEDGPNTLDPVLDYTAPADAKSIVIGVLDGQGRGGPRGIYRLVVTPLPTKKADPVLLTTAQRVNVPDGGAAVFHVGIDRGAYSGAVELSAENLPAGFAVENATIPPGADGTLVTLRRSDGAAAGVTTWRGKADDGDAGPVVVKGHPLDRLQPWLATEIAVAPTRSKGADFAIDYRGLPGDAGLVPAGKLAVPFKLTRPAADKSVVRVALLTSQLGPLATPPADPNTQLRLEKAVEVSATVTEGDASVIVPPTLTAPVYDLTLKAELLTADKQKVLATAFAPVRRMALRPPLVLEAASARVEAKRDPKANVTVEIAGRLERREGATGDVQLTLTGLPPGIPAVPVTTVKADATTFAIKVTVPPNQPVGETPLKLSGTIAASPQQPNVRVRSREVELTLAVQ